MVAMTIADAWPTTGREFTVADLERTPDDGRRYEVIDGLLVVSPAPSVWHQEVTAELLCVLRHGCPPDMRALPGLGVRMSLKTELIPDIVVAFVQGSDRADAHRAAAAGGGGSVAEYGAV